MPAAAPHHNPPVSPLGFHRTATRTMSEAPAPFIDLDQLKLDANQARAQKALQDLVADFGNGDKYVACAEAWTLVATQDGGDAAMRHLFCPGDARCGVPYLTAKLRYLKEVVNRPEHINHGNAELFKRALDVSKFLLTNTKVPKLWFDIADRLLANPTPGLGLACVEPSLSKVVGIVLRCFPKPKHAPLWLAALELMNRVVDLDGVAKKDLLCHVYPIATVMHNNMNIEALAVSVVKLLRGFQRAFPDAWELNVVCPSLATVAEAFPDNHDLGIMVARFYFRLSDPCAGSVSEARQLLLTGVMFTLVNILSRRYKKVELSIYVTGYLCNVASFSDDISLLSMVREVVWNARHAHPENQRLVENIGALYLNLSRNPATHDRLVGDMANMLGAALEFFPGHFGVFRPLILTGLRMVRSPSAAKVLARGCKQLFTTALERLAVFRVIKNTVYQMAIQEAGRRLLVRLELELPAICEDKEDPELEPESVPTGDGDGDGDGDACGGAGSGAGGAGTGAAPRDEDKDEEDFTGETRAKRRVVATDA